MAVRRITSGGIEESDDMLDYNEPEPVKFWKVKQRELVTSVVDYNIESLAQLVQKNTIDMGPDYQRRYRWDKKRQSKLIESFLINVPIPPIFLNEDDFGKYSVIDGKQRLRAIADFFSGALTLDGLEVFGDVNGKTIFEIPPTLQIVLRTRPTLRAVIILRQSDDDVKYEVFKRLNTGGVSLNPQEIRNSTFLGPLNDLILKLSKNAKFHSLLGIKNISKSRIWKEMRDAEFVLRYFTFKDNWHSFEGGMKRHMDNYMDKYRDLDKNSLDKLEHSFLLTIDCAEAAFGTGAFKRYEPEHNRWRNQILAALFDAEMFACQNFTPDELLPYQDRIIENLKALFSNKDFRKTIDAATNTPSSFKARIDMTFEMITNTINSSVQ